MKKRIPKKILAELKIFESILRSEKDYIEKLKEENKGDNEGHNNILDYSMSESTLRYIRCRSFIETTIFIFIAPLLRRMKKYTRAAVEIEEELSKKRKNIDNKYRKQWKKSNDFYERIKK